MLKEFTNGTQLLEFIPCDEPIVPDGDDTPLTWAMAVIRNVEGDRFLLHHNHNRRQWECAGGGLEVGETMRDCIIRETMEETSQKIIDISCQGIFKLYHRNQNDSHFGALYTGIVETLYPFKVNNESDRITLWHPDERLDDRISELSHWMIEYVRNLA